jgi:hypothetical protein
LENKLPPEIKIIKAWNDWILWDMRTTGSIVNFCAYTEMRFWLYENFGVQKKTKINEKNFMSVWFYISRNLNKHSLLRMNSKNEYKIKKRYNGYTAILQKNENGL